MKQKIIYFSKAETLKLTFVSRDASGEERMTFAVAKQFKKGRHTDFFLHNVRAMYVSVLVSRETASLSLSLSRFVSLSVFLSPLLCLSLAVSLSLSLCLSLAVSLSLCPRWEIRLLSSTNQICGNLMYSTLLVYFTTLLSSNLRRELLSCSLKSSNALKTSKNKKKCLY